jgi:hypothetical protein
MLKRFIAGGVVGAAMLVGAQRAHAQQQTVNFTLGYFAPHGEDARTAGDVLVANRDFLIFDFHDFDAASVGGEWLFPVRQFSGRWHRHRLLDAIGPTVYQDFIDSDGTEIDSDMKLRMVPTTVQHQAAPSQSSHRVPAVYRRRHGESSHGATARAASSWISTQATRFFRGSFVNTGADVGPVILGGLRFGGRSVSAGFEVRYQSAEGKLDSDFAGPRIDLGGWTYNGTFGFRF